ncbi:ureidoglycolate lyase [Rhodovibrio salinarum]|uniref:Ureidoglycolate lyase n=1 Tax=Rhodovibrio salinarum TaxID=1087 RepID=A0A934V0Z5_9PROT|nr:ureidoglycolate lyase [Rhodovibrio salinarum]MBK1698156.1 ureidoglycolate lyase [Rhodovibrio salinarum]
MITLRPEPLTAEGFAPFGTVIQRDGAENYLINDGTTRRFNALSHVDPGPEGEVIVSIFHGARRPSPIAIRMLERHPLGDQAFFPLGGGDWLVVVAPGEQPTPANCRCFRAGPDQGVRYARGVWHHPLLVLDATQDFLVLDRHGPGTNLEERIFEPDTETVIEGI